MTEDFRSVSEKKDERPPSRQKYQATCKKKRRRNCERPIPGTSERGLLLGKLGATERTPRGCTLNGR